MLAGWYTGLSDSCFALRPLESSRTSADVVPHTSAPVLAWLLTAHRLYLAACPEPPVGTHTLVDVNAFPSVQAGRGAERCQTLRSTVSRWALAGVWGHTASTITTWQLTHSCLAPRTGPSRGTGAHVVSHAGSSVGTRRGAHGRTTGPRVPCGAVTGIWSHTDSVVLAGGIAHRPAFGGVIGADGESFIAAAVVGAQEVITRLFTSAASEVRTFIDIITGPPVTT